MSIDTSKLRSGDEIAIRAIFVRKSPVGDIYVRVETPDHGAEGRVLPGEIVSHTPRPLAVGDQVWGCTTKENGEVLHVIDDLAWVKFEDGRHEIVLPEQVERTQ